ncbi:MAG: ExeM/NucH family extracellular endonuclease [Xanthomonadales bacterium]|jgi:predicted extracellular nuclease|nr:ExeM/NucH family extracellular endonuclease [Xanthomonadales bacterium]
MTGKFATLALATLILTGCGDSTDTLDRCPAPTHAIHEIQGSDWRSPLEGKFVAVNGVLTHIADAGFYLESLEPDADPDTSEGLFIQSRRPPTAELTPGTVVTVSGRVLELGETRDTQTAVGEIDRLQVCGPPRARPETPASLPLGGRDREALENMRVTLEGTSIVTDVYRLDEGRFRIALDRPLAQPTEVTRPGDDANRLEGHNWAHSLHVALAAGDDAVFAVGDELLSESGVLGAAGRGPLLLLETPAHVLHQPIPRLAAPGPDTLRVVSLNLENYFNGDGDGSGFPTPRGAETPAEFDRQRARLAESIAQLNPHVLAVQEIENDGFDAGSAAEDFRADLGGATGYRWAVARPRQDRVGTDEIAVGLFYRSDLFEPLGPAELLDAAPFDLLNRTPLGQALRHADSGMPLFIAVNHFKSKGGCPEQGRDQDQDDGQGCWNPARVAAARSLAPWVQERADQLADGFGLILGDLNAYRMEDPVQQLLMDGFHDLTAVPGPGFTFSYVFRGEAGSLDHALSTRDLVSRVAGAGIPNVNSIHPRRMALEPDWLGASDHDPVVVDLRLIQASTSD